jgi:hypothetical protein
VFGLTVHVVTTTSLLDVDTALGARLCAELLDGLLGLLVLLPLYAAAGAGVPGAVAGQTELVVAVWAGCLIHVGLLLCLFGLGLGLATGSLVLGTAVFGGEVDTAFWVETGHVRSVSSEEMLGDRGVPSVCCQ